MPDYTPYFDAFLFMGGCITISIVFITVLECINFYKSHKARKHMENLLAETSANVQKNAVNMSSMISTPYSGQYN